MEEKYIGLGLAITSSMAIGTSFIITKLGLIDQSDKDGFEGEGYSYLKNPIWWAGMVTMIVGEIANFAAYAFAPAILVTPLGALSVLIGAILGAYFLKEELGILGKLGCALCLIGSVIIVLHAPADRDVQTVDEILEFALHPAFMLYCLIVLVFSVVMIYKVAPKYGKKNPIYYISICSTVGSVSVMAIKAFGIALKLTMAGNNQFTHPSTYVFGIVVVVCILTQMNYFNKALAQFPTSIVNPVYYVTFTTATLCASFILFRGFNTTDPVNTISLICGFLIIFSGVYLLNLSRSDPNGHQVLGRPSVEGFPTDGLAVLSTRRSMQIRRSFGDGASLSAGHFNHRRSGSLNVPGRMSTSLMRSFDEERAVGLEDLAEESGSDTDDDKEDVALRKESRRPPNISTAAPRRSLHSGPITPRTPRTPTGGFKRLA